MSRLTFDVYDGVAPEEGTVFVGARSRYLVLRVRPVESRQWHDRWALEVRRLAKDEAIPEGAKVQEFRSYEPGECPSCVARANGIPVPDGLVCRGAG